MTKLEQREQDVMAGRIWLRCYYGAWFTLGDGEFEDTNHKTVKQALAASKRQMGKRKDPAVAWEVFQDEQVGDDPEDTEPIPIHSSDGRHLPGVNSNQAKGE